MTTVPAYELWIWRDDPYLWHDPLGAGQLDRTQPGLPLKLGRARPWRTITNAAGRPRRLAPLRDRISTSDVERTTIVPYMQVDEGKAMRAMPMTEQAAVTLTPAINTDHAIGTFGQIAHKKNTRAILAAVMIWAVSGSSLVGLGDQHVVYFIYAILQALICFRLRITPARGAGVVTAITIYAVWTVIAAGVGMPDQFTGLVGMCLRISIVLLPLVFVKRPLVAVVDVMAALCWISLPIFLVRQIGLLAHFDIAVIFSPFYQALGSGADRTIIFYNFHTIGEELRNSGAFREPGMFACNIVMAAMLCVVPGIGIDSPKVRRRLTLFFVTLLTTGSTTGFTTVPIFALIAMPYFIRSRAHRIILAPILAIIFAILIIAFGTSHFDKIGNQMVGLESQKSAWYNTRFGNCVVDSQAITERPMLGYGYSEEGRPILFTVYNYHYGDSLGFGNGFSGTAVKFGLIATFILYFLFLLCLTRLYGSALKGSLIFFCLGMLLFSQQLLLLPAIYLFLYSKYKENFV